MQRNPLRPVQVPATAKGGKIVTGRGEACAPKNGRYARSNALVLAILDREVVRGSLPLSTPSVEPP